MRCEHERPDGTRCKTAALRGRRLCFFHDPSMAKKRKAARSRGGLTATIPTRAAVLPADTPDLKLETAADVKKLLAETINQARRGQLAVNVANAIGQLAGVLIKVIPGADFEARLLSLETRK